MFTGIIQDIGTVTAITKKGDWRITIETALNLAETPIGASICCSGCCLTVVQKSAKAFDVDVSQESLARSGIGQWSVGTKVNLEPSLRLGDELGGHFVFGHLDGLATIKEIKAAGGSHIFTIAYKGGLIAPKGSVTLDGVSLTVNDVKDGVFTVNIIPHTMANTTLGLKKPGETLNLEFDMLARYVANILKKEAA